ncbi:MAG: bifunctional UDP-N-acetylglucosamine diphosphorylase/glucosamine-1-phosphate N-acetyltransferase GlmU [Candidatus Aminicenantales bacterium]
MLSLILASGRQAGFKSEKNKFLHPILGKSMFQQVAETVLSMKPERLYVLLDRKEDVEEARKSVRFSRVDFIQPQSQGMKAILSHWARKTLIREKEKDLLVVSGDMPLIQPPALKALWSFHRNNGNALTLMETESRPGCVRIVRLEKGRIKVIPERQTPSQTGNSREVSPNLCIIRVRDLLQILPGISGLSKEDESWLAAIARVLAGNRKKMDVFSPPSLQDVFQINNRLDLARAAAVLRDRKIRQLARSGVTVYDPSSVWIDLDVRIGKDTVLYPSVILEGKTVIGKQCWIYPGAHLTNTRVGNRVKILSFTVIDGATIEDNVQVGPFARIRPKTILRSGSKVGNFVEMKTTDFGRRSKAGHLTYLGDCEIQEDVNIGAGTITCNYDGVKKHKTLVESKAFIGSGTELVAPLKVGRGAYVGAGSTITKDVSPWSLAVNRGRQIEKTGWARRRKKK